jgi:heme/copper-type cytochrome/quinol oxidase subunit 2
MGKAAAIVVLLVTVGLILWVIAALLWGMARRARAARWERAKRRAQWEEHTDASQDCTQDGTPIAEVTVRKVARMGSRCEVLETRPVTKVAAPDPFAPELIEAKALAWARADTLNQLKAAGL